MSNPEEEMKKNALELVVLRNAFYRDNYYRALYSLLLLVVVNLALVGMIVYEWDNPPAPQYFATTATGVIIKIHALSDPVVPDNFVTQFASDAVRKAFDLDYVHWQDQLQEASNNFTPYGWRWFIKALQDSNNLKSLTSLKMVSNASVTGAPQILEKEIVGGRYAWKIRMPLLVTYTAGEANTIRMPMNITLIVIRVPVKDNPQRIAINNFIPEVTGS
jgi:intracellular multiplication protein IcmL